MRKLIVRHLVRLRQNDQKRDLIKRQPMDELQVLLRRIPPDIKDQNHKSQGVALPEVGLDHRSPQFSDRLGDLRIAISGKIDEGETVVDAEEIDLLGSTRRVAGPGQFLPVQEGVDQG